ncbi:MULTISPECIES: precorrin-2 C(20)-methyltransferase [Bacillales]|jgi:precorrin-2/cobalt-factor-2 C20-methyltransferase|uniref:Precorrin-2 C(20)-methyltransferase n=1 Tax=Peribacillus simplex TaxID=1478 RepID=A0A9W4PI05_9BACI|nr:MULTISPECIES: precorrin-2 C(20)-methyltransferase [Bacillales]TDL91902.1 precorrin-2 C(20)-methyltransferase [Vibrio vulnificus]MBT2647520.1 precorrin-2 C(20)-methyltransferase [Bacillus sp. ISL-34]MCK1983367.1 precorrin-2 C(20)-methyltransferase [Peribacillus sp. Aquil_B1]MCK2006385.1 precorrin-2 C(20)-methyltransferase [Peribacillus sp. Aquil_B8]PEZ80497.1 precorrin-2 C(20)-methyltransferase [Bacillus sp. AFS017274]
MSNLGTLYGLGVGPGDPELITVKAFRVIQESPVIAYPKKRKGSKSYAHRIVEVYIRPEEKDMLGLVFPMTKDQAILDREWNGTVEKVWQKLNEGKDVAFVTEGDPLLYSTFIHMMKLMQELHPEVEIKTVPGISSFNGSASRLGIALADGDDHVAIVPARDDYEAMKKAIEDHDAVVFIKVAKVIDLMITVLKDLDLLEKASVVTKVTSDEEVIWKVSELEGLELEYLTLMVVRK